MTHLPFFARMFEKGFQIGCVPLTILDVIPNNTPVNILQGIYYDEKGNEIITDGELLIQNKWHLWLWIHEQPTLSYVEFNIPGNVIWQLHLGELKLSCSHHPTLRFWVSEIMKKLKIDEETSMESLLYSRGSAKILISQDLKELQLG
jgi:hypothetical protein